ncbi:hypothetical protein D3C87_1778690 [compost metagenome]
MRSYLSVPKMMTLLPAITRCPPPLRLAVRMVESGIQRPPSLCSPNSEMMDDVKLNSVASSALLF